MPTWKTCFLSASSMRLEWRLSGRRRYSWQREDMFCNNPGSPDGMQFMQDFFSSQQKRLSDQKNQRRRLSQKIQMKEDRWQSSSPFPGLHVWGMLWCLHTSVYFYIFCESWSWCLKYVNEPCWGLLSLVPYWPRTVSWPRTVNLCAHCHTMMWLCGQNHGLCSWTIRSAYF